jgi:hypothetical protein
MGRSVCVVGRGDVRRVGVGQGSRGCREGKYLLFFEVAWFDFWIVPCDV